MNRNRRNRLNSSRMQREYSGTKIDKMAFIIMSEESPRRQDSVSGVIVFMRAERFFQDLQGWRPEDRTGLPGPSPD